MTNRVHNSACIEGDVEIGSRVTVSPFAVLQGPLTIADDVWIGPGAHVGGAPEIRSLDIPSWGMPQGRGVTIGTETVIREGVTIHSGTWRPTQIGHSAYLMAKSHIGHDALVEDWATIACGACVGGHTTIGKFANLGLNAVVHQRRIVGDYAMIGMQAAATDHVPPAAIAVGVPAKWRKLNTRGLLNTGVDVAASSVESWMRYIDSRGHDAVPPALAALAPSARRYWRQIEELSTIQ